MSSKLSGCLAGDGIQAEPENVQCPRCESTNTKFCYYNNYNLSQPRYFCKSCRRYWTRGGSLRNIPVGGGSRKNSKRSRLSHPPPKETLPSSLIGSAQQENPFIELGGYGLAPGFNGLGFASGPAMGGRDDGSADDQVAVPSSGLYSWQVGEEVNDGDCFGWPELAISTPETPRFEPTFWPANSSFSIAENLNL